MSFSNPPQVDTSRSWSCHIHTDGEEWVNGLTHGIGCVIGLIGSVVLLSSALRGAPSYQFVSCLVYCVALVGVYGSSTLSHWVRAPRWRHRFRAWDQGMIFILIVATYTPLAVALLSGWWHLLTTVLWGLAIIGFTSKVAHLHRIDNIVLGFYLVLGWIPIVALPAMWNRSHGLAALVMTGGLAYTLGALLLANDHRQKYLHAAWHLLVITGSACHYFGIYWYVLPAA